MAFCCPTGVRDKGEETASRWVLAEGTGTTDNQEDGFPDTGSETTLLCRSPLDRINFDLGVKSRAELEPLRHKVLGLS